MGNAINGNNLAESPQHKYMHEYQIIFGIDRYWITREEMDFYMRERLKPGTEFIVLRNGEMVLPPKFQRIIHRNTIKLNEKIEEGFWQCRSGTWHPEQVEECTCDRLRFDPQTGLLHSITDGKSKDTEIDF